MDYKGLVERLNSFSAEHELHGGVTAEAADAIEALLKERDCLMQDLRGICDCCKHKHGPIEFCRKCSGKNELWEWCGLEEDESNE